MINKYHSTKITDKMIVNISQSELDELENEVNERYVLNKKEW